MAADNRLRVVTWLHLEDREEYGDFYEDGSPIAHTREVWKSIDVGPWCYGPESLSRSVPVTEPEARTLLVADGTGLEDMVYSKLGVGSRSSSIGYPKGPYYDPLSTTTIQEKLRQALAEPDAQRDSQQDRRGEAVRTDLSVALGSRLVEGIRADLAHDVRALERISQQDFQQLVAELLRSMKYDIQGADNNTLFAYKMIPPVGPLLFAVECVSRDSTKWVKLGEVRQFVDSMQLRQADRGMFVTTSYFTSGARSREEQRYSPVSLHDQGDVKAWLGQYGEWERNSNGDLWVPSGWTRALEYPKERQVLLLGDFRAEGRSRLAAIEAVINRKGYQSVILDQIGDLSDYSRLGKMAAIGQLCRFVIIDDSSRSGHFAEMNELQRMQAISLVIQLRGTRSSSVVQGFDATSKNFMYLDYDLDTLESCLSTGIQWAERRVNEMREHYTKIYSLAEA